MIDWDELIDKSLKLENAASHIQNDENVGVSPHQIEEIFSGYMQWYSQCLILLGRRIEDTDILVQFKSYYEGFSVKPQIREFFEAPTENNFSRQASTEYEKRKFKWKYPYEETFYRPLIRQRMILAQAKARESAYVPHQYSNTQEHIYTRPNETFSENAKLTDEVLFDSRNLHKSVWEHGRTPFLRGGYFHAVFECCKAFEKSVRQASKLDKKSGTGLMSAAFSLDKGTLKFSKLQSISERDEQEGFMYLCMGLMSSIRNLGGHEPAKDRPMRKEEALEILSFISFLHRQLDRMHYTEH